MVGNKADTQIGTVPNKGEAGIHSMPASPLGQLGLAVLAVLSFKIFLALQLDGPGHAAMLAALSDGGFLQQMMARLLVPDAVSQMLIEAMRARGF